MLGLQGRVRAKQCTHVLRPVCHRLLPQLLHQGVSLGNSAILVLVALALPPSMIDTSHSSAAVPGPLFAGKIARLAPPALKWGPLAARLARCGEWACGAAWVWAGLPSLELLCCPTNLNFSLTSDCLDLCYVCSRPGNYKTDVSDGTSDMDFCDECPVRQQQRFSSPQHLLLWHCTCATQPCLTIASPLTCSDPCR